MGDLAFVSLGEIVGALAADNDGGSWVFYVLKSKFYLLVIFGIFGGLFLLLIFAFVDGLNEGRRLGNVVLLF